MRTWRGIPYAAPPRGPLRFRAPRSPAPWRGIRDASRFGTVPPQNRGLALTGSRRRQEMSEDCLTIHVSAPLEPGTHPLPVLVYFYGGAFSSGASAVRTYRGAQLVRSGQVVYVAMNYRIGALGFMDFSAYSTPQRPFETNLGLRDQVAALEWIQANIAPSGAYHPHMHAAWARDLLGILGVSEAGAAEALSTLPAARLVQAATRLTTRVGPARQPGTLSVSPVIDGGFLPRHPMDAFDAGTAAPVPLVLGTMADEGALFAEVDDILPSTPKRLQKTFAATDPDALERAAAAYPGYPSRERSVQISGDLVFWYPVQRVAEGHSRVAPTWAYRYDFATPLMNLLGFGATHAFDVPVMFGETEEPVVRARRCWRRKRDPGPLPQVPGHAAQPGPALPPGQPLAGVRGGAQAHHGLRPGGPHRGGSVSRAAADLGGIPRVRLSAVVGRPTTASADRVPEPAGATPVMESAPQS